MGKVKSLIEILLKWLAKLVAVHKLRKLEQDLEKENLTLKREIADATKIINDYDDELKHKINVLHVPEPTKLRKSKTKSVRFEYITFEDGTIIGGD